MTKYQREKINKKYLRKFTAYTMFLFFTHYRVSKRLISDLKKEIAILHDKYGKLWDSTKYETYKKDCKCILSKIKEDRKSLKKNAKDSTINN